jgi:hypothetical protein
MAPPLDRRGGWRFATQWPPEVESHAGVIQKRGNTMVKFVLEIDCSKAAFGPGGSPSSWRDSDRAHEVARILHAAAERIEREPPGDNAPLELFDDNQNCVGKATFTDEP